MSADAAMSPDEADAIVAASVRSVESDVDELRMLWKEQLVVLAGASGAGKTSLVRALRGQPFEEEPRVPRRGPTQSSIPSSAPTLPPLSCILMASLAFALTCSHKRTSKIILFQMPLCTRLAS